MLRLISMLEGIKGLKSVVEGLRSVVQDWESVAEGDQGWKSVAERLKSVKSVVEGQGIRGTGTGEGIAIDLLFEEETIPPDSTVTAFSDESGNISKDA